MADQGDVRLSAISSGMRRRLALGKALVHDPTALVLVNPFDVEGVARAIHDAVEMEPEERRDRMHRLRASIRKQDIYWWLECFLTGAMAEDLATSLLVDDYIPPHKRRTA